jgi:hypothetical protein
MKLLDDKKFYDEAKKNCAERKWEVDHKALKEPLAKYFGTLQKQLN